jgi:hypothetical protein
VHHSVVTLRDAQIIDRTYTEVQTSALLVWSSISLISALKTGRPIWFIATGILVGAARAGAGTVDRRDGLVGMLRVLAAYLRGDQQSCSMVRVPAPEEEDAKRMHRERESLVQERLRMENRIEALLFTHGIRHSEKAVSSLVGARFVCPAHR